MNEPKRKTLRARLTGWLKGETTPGVDPDVVRDMAKLLEETGLSEIEVERGGVRVRVAKNGHGKSAPAGHAVPAAPVQAAAPVPQSAPAVNEPPKVEAPVKRGTPVNSPMVGTVYLSPQPGAPVFVQPGTTVKEGDTICIIEAMKTMNPVAAPVSGRIAEIQVSDAQPVEFNQLLMLIE
jgi:acetyl-CoA carboxylase biotin carboxyl carrier protein